MKFATGTRLLLSEPRRWSPRRVEPPVAAAAAQPAVATAMYRPVHRATLRVAPERGSRGKLHAGSSVFALSSSSEDEDEDDESMHASKASQRSHHHTQQPPSGRRLERWDDSRGGSSTVLPMAAGSVLLSDLLGESSVGSVNTQGSSSSRASACDGVGAAPAVGGSGRPQGRPQCHGAQCVDLVSSDDDAGQHPVSCEHAEPLQPPPSEEPSPSPQPGNRHDAAACMEGDGSARSEPARSPEQMQGQGDVDPQPEDEFELDIQSESDDDDDPGED